MVETQVGPFPGIRGPCTTQAVDRMKDGKPGDTITPVAMAEIIGRDCGSQTLGRGNVDSAIRIVEREYSIIWRWDRDQKHWLCLNDDQKSKISRNYVQQTRRRAKRGLIVLAATDPEALASNQRQEHDLTRAQLAAVVVMSSADFTKRLKAIERPQEPNMPKLLELMDGKIPLPNGGQNDRQD